MTNSSIIDNITLLLFSPDTPNFTLLDDTFTIDMVYHDITIKVNPDDTITINDETTYSNLDEFTSNFFQDYI